MHFARGLLRWTNWDGTWYRFIAVKGYIIRYNFHGGETVAFFPFFPFTIKTIHHFLHLPILAVGFSINAICTIAIAFFLYKLTMLLMASSPTKNHRAGKVAVIAFLLNPSAFFLAAYYAEPILVLCFTAAIYFSLKKHYVVAALFAAVASATKIDGAVLAIIIMLLYGQQTYLPTVSVWQNIRNSGAKLIGLGSLSVSGLIAFFGYLWTRFHNPLVGLQNQKYWGRQSGNFILNLWHSEYSHIASNYYFGDKLDYSYHLYVMAVPFLIVFALYVCHKHQRQLWLCIFTLLLLALPIVSGTLTSLNRVMLVFTPLLSCVVVAVLKHPKQYVRTTAVYMLGISSLLLFVFTAAYLGNYFVG
jgi:hypothetical protein